MNLLLDICQLTLANISESCNTVLFKTLSPVFHPEAFLLGFVLVSARANFAIFDQGQSRLSQARNDTTIRENFCYGLMTCLWHPEWHPAPSFLPGLFTLESKVVEVF